MIKRTLVLAVAAFVMTANLVLAATTAIGGAPVDATAGVDTTVLLQFYPTPLATSPVGAIEDKAVWLAKVQGLIAAAPPLLRQSMLASTTKQDFAANLTLLQQLQKGTLDEGVVAAKSVAKSSKLTAKDSDGKAGPNLGSGPADTVYMTLEPCRIMDSRSATVDSGVRGPLVGNHLYQLHGFLPAGEVQNWGDYGGNATSDCGLNSTIGANIWALAIVITVLNPNFDAYLGVGDKNTLAATLSTVALNYTHGQGLSTQYIVPQGINAIYFAMPAQLSANIIFDVVGYFAVSQATKLDCQYPHADGSGTVADAGDILLLLPQCDVGYAVTGHACDSVDYESRVPLISSGNMFDPYSYCAWVNNTGHTVDAAGFVATTVCCRVPGR